MAADMVLERPIEQQIEVAESDAMQQEDWIELEDSKTDQSFELIEGELVPKARTDNEHGIICGRLIILLGIYARSLNRQARIGGEGTTFFTRTDDRTVRKPDVVFSFYGEHLPLGQTSEFYMHIPPDLVVEVLSPGNSAIDMDDKIQEWFTFGVKLVWLVYPKSGRVYIYPDNRHATILFRDEAISGGAILPGFEAPIKAFFED